ncbi:MAG TPA: hypothetical protein VJP04_08940 [Terriglobales bacterium]|nr:hypothetical protein [Terriglobales bacterium]
MLARLEHRLSAWLRHTPRLRLAARRGYQFTLWAASRPDSTPGLLTVTRGEGEHLGGYYGTPPWDSSGRYLLTLLVSAAFRHPRPGETAEIRLIDCHNGYAARPLAVTRAWNLQQGCMLQWLGPDFSRRILYNDFRDGAYCAVILDLPSGREQVVPAPAYAVSCDGSQALSLDFSRLHRMRPGYGYSHLPDSTAGQLCPSSPCIWRLDLACGVAAPILCYSDLADFQSRREMQGAEHKVNHLMISPSGKRFLLLHIWRRGPNARYLRLLTADLEGGNLCSLLDDDLVSHCCYRDDDHILTWARKCGLGDGYLLLTDRSSQAQPLWRSVLSRDGHPSYSPDGSWVVTDSYPDRQRISRVWVVCVATGEVREAARVFTPFRYEGEARCDLHPRWSRDGRRICFDAAFEGTRQSYVAANPFLPA